MDLKKLLKCPICRVIPEKKIFQCRNGHHICEKCRDVCDRCPQCNLQYGRKQIRNLLGEAIRDGLEEPCPYNESGCKEMIKRKDLPTHRKICNFRSKNLLCEMLGLHACHFDPCSKGPFATVSHILSNHESQVVENPAEMTIRLSRYVVKWYLQEPELKDRYKTLSRCTTLVKVHPNVSVHDVYSSFMLCWLTNARNYSWICLHLGAFTYDNPNFKVQFTLSNAQAEDNNFEYKWTDSVYSHKNVDKLFENPPVVVSLDFLKEIPVDKVDKHNLFLHYKIIYNTK